MKRLRIAYISTYDSENVNNWSGSGYYISKTVEKYLGDVDYIGNLKSKRFIENVFKKMYNRVLYNKGFLIERTTLVGKYYAAQVEYKLKNKKYDLIISPGTIPISYLKVDVPIIFWTDATFSSMIDYYFFNLSTAAIEDGNAMERSALENAALAIYSSEWAANSAIKDYQINREKVKVIPFGANIKTVPKSVKIQKISYSLQLLFVGKDWERKGLRKAIEAVKMLNDWGVESKLTVVGCNPDLKVNKKQVEFKGFLDKNREKDSLILSKLYKNAHFFILPTKAEAYGIVLCEANAFGIPVLAANTGGIPTNVKDGYNGYLIPVKAKGTDYALKIKSIIDDGKYEQLRLNSRKRYKQVLNWDSAGEKLKEEIDKIL